MAVTLRVPGSLSRFLENRSEFQYEAPTVDALLQALEAQYGGVAQRLIGESRTLHRFVRVFVNGSDLGAAPNVLETRLADGDVVSVLMAVAGG